MAFRRGFRRRFVAPPEETHKINRKIRAPQVRLIAADGRQVGVVPLEEALRHAEEAHLDLVEIAAKAEPPVCRILDYGKFKYQQHKKEAEARRKAATTQVKELRLSYRTDKGDIKRQIDKAKVFLGDGDRVKFILRFRGREMAYQHLGREKLLSICKELEEVGTIDGHPRMEGRMMSALLAPVRKKVAGKSGQKSVAPVQKSVEKATAESAAG